MEHMYYNIEMLVIANFQNNFLLLFSLQFHRRVSEQHMHCHREVVSIKVFECPEKDCLFSGRSAAELRVHQSTHSNEKNFSCSFESCEYKTKTQSLLNR